MNFDEYQTVPDNPQEDDVWEKYNDLNDYDTDTNHKNSQEPEDEE